MKTENMSIWLWRTDAPCGGYLYHGNPNPQCPPYHVGGIDNLVYGDRLVRADTRRQLEMELGVVEWNEKFPQFRVYPVSVMVEIRQFYKRTKKKGGVE